MLYVQCTCVYSVHMHFIYLSIYLYIYLSIYPYIFVYRCMYIYICLYPSHVYVVVDLGICSSIYIHTVRENKREQERAREREGERERDTKRDKESGREGEGLPAFSSR